MADMRGKILWRDLPLVQGIIIFFFIPAFIALNYSFIFHRTDSYWLNNIIYVFLTGFGLLLLLSSFKKHQPKRSYLKFFIIMITFYAILIFVPKYLETAYPNLVVNSINGTISSIMLNIFIIIALISAIRIKSSYITENGIRIGNDYLKNDEDIRIKQHPKFIEWTNIKELKIKEKPNGVNLTYYLCIKTKNNNTNYTSRLIRIKKFESTLKILHKDKMLVKDFKYSKLRDSNIPFEEKERQADKLEKEDRI